MPLSEGNHWSKLLLSFLSGLKVAQGSQASLQPGLALVAYCGQGAGHGTRAREQLLYLTIVKARERKLKGKNVGFHLYQAFVSQTFLDALPHWNSIK